MLRSKYAMQSAINRGTILIRRMKREGSLLACLFIRETFAFSREIRRGQRGILEDFLAVPRRFSRR